MKVLIVEDEKQLADALVEIMKMQHFSADAVYDGQDGLNYAKTGNYDIIVLDMMLPKLNGLDVLRALKKAKVNTPVIFLTAKSDVTDKITGLDCGADDYLTKPFSSAELVARIKAVQRRKNGLLSDNMEACGLSLNPDTYELAYGNQKIRLGGKEYQIMECLMSQPLRIWPKEQLIEKIWGYDCEAEYNIVEVYISFLRKKLTAINAPAAIKAVRFAGYSLENSDGR